MNWQSTVPHVRPSRGRSRARWRQASLATLLVSFCGCATTSQGRRPAPGPIPGAPSAAARAGDGVATGLRYVFGFPVVIFGHIAAGGKAENDVATDLQKVRDYQPGHPPETGDSVLRNETTFW